VGVGVGVINATRRGLFPTDTDPVPIVNEVVWAPGPVWTVVENPTLTGIRSLDCLARVESLYRLRCIGPQNHTLAKHIIASRGRMQSFLF
jgi:hypothetical protein